MEISKASTELLLTANATKTGPTSTGTTESDDEDDGNGGNENAEHRVGERSTERRIT